MHLENVCYFRTFASAETISAATLTAIAKRLRQTVQYRQYTHAGRSCFILVKFIVRKYSANSRESSP
jgi:hypothetical protein